MQNAFICTPRTPAEQLAFQQACALPRIPYGSTPPARGPLGMSCSAVAYDFFQTTLDEDFQLDAPVAAALLLQLAQTDPEAALQMLAPVEELPAKPLTEREADAAFQKLWGSLRDSLIGGGNLPGNTVGVVETSLRLAWRQQALRAFEGLKNGSVQSRGFGANIQIYSSRIDASGRMLKRAQIRVRVRKLPVQVVQQLSGPFVASHGGKVGQIRISARSNAKALGQVADHVADARILSSKVLRGAGTRFGSGVLAFGPSAVIDFYDSASYQNGRLDVNWKDFGIRSAKSQSGNLVGMATSALVTGGLVAFGAVAAVGWPVVVIGLGVGIAAQTVWGFLGGDETAANRARAALE